MHHAARCLVTTLLFSALGAAQIFNDPAPPSNLQALTTTGIPRVGNAVTFTVTGSPGDAVGLLFAAQPASFPFPPFGTVLFDPRSFIVGVNSVISPGGSSTILRTVLPVARAGSLLTVQAIVLPAQGNATLTNASRIYILGAGGQLRNNVEVDPLPAMTQSTSLTVTGRTSASGSRVRIEGGDGIVSALSNLGASGDEFAATVALRPNQRNRLFFTETTPTGTMLQPVPVDVVQDSQAPEVFIDFPAVGQGITSGSVTLAGRVSDTLSGFAGLAVDVTVLGVTRPAIVNRGIGTNGTWEAAGLPMNPVGTPTTFTVVARDGVGNASAPMMRTLTRRALVGPRMSVVGGDGQSGQIHALLAQPIEIEIRRADGSPYCRKVVTFEVTRSDGRLSAASNMLGDLIYQTTTDAQGRARAYWRLGADAGCGNNRVEVTSRDISGFVAFCASAHPAPPVQINIGLGDGQVAETGAALPQPLRVWVSDTCNGVEGVPVLFEVIRGGGLLDGGALGPVSGLTVQTGPTGHADVPFNLGNTPGNNIVYATMLGTQKRVTFQAVGLAPAVGGATTFTGIVLDNAERPIGGATCLVEYEDGSTSVWVPSDVEGSFSIPLTATGSARLHVNGRTATQLAGGTIPTGSFPPLAFDVVVVPAAENSLPQPVVLPAQDPRNVRIYDGVSDLELTVEGIEGLRMLVRAGSMRMPDGRPAPPGTELSLNQVHIDKIPMAMTDGAAPPFAWTLQPGGATFDPPIQITYPNMSGLPPGAVAYFLSFNHDTGQFEIVSSASVTADGSCIESDPGDGLSVAGWGCNCPPYSVATDCENCMRTCADRGTVSGGDAESSHRKAAPGTTVTFSVTQEPTDSGGTVRFVCPNGSSSTQPTGAGILFYDYEIEYPDGTIVSGPVVDPNLTVSFTAGSQCGEYECRLRVQAIRECPPGPRVFASPTFEVRAVPITDMYQALSVNNPNIVEGSGHWGFAPEDGICVDPAIDVEFDAGGSGDLIWVVDGARQPQSGSSFLLRRPISVGQHTIAAFEEELSPNPATTRAGPGAAGECDEILEFSAVVFDAMPLRYTADIPCDVIPFIPFTGSNFFGVGGGVKLDMEFSFSLSRARLLSINPLPMTRWYWASQLTITNQPCCPVGLSAGAASLGSFASSRTWSVEAARVSPHQLEFEFCFNAAAGIPLVNMLPIWLQGPEIDGEVEMTVTQVCIDGVLDPLLGRGTVTHDAYPRHVVSVGGPIDYSYDPCLSGGSCPPPLGPGICLFGPFPSETGPLLHSSR